MITRGRIKKQGEESMDTLPIISNAVVTVFSIGLLIISLASYLKYKGVKLLLISIVFLTYSIKGVLMSIHLFINKTLFTDGLLASSIFDLVTLLLFYIATLTR